jgi:hypothetical protein
MFTLSGAKILLNFIYKPPTPFERAVYYIQILLEPPKDIYAFLELYNIISIFSY